MQAADYQKTMDERWPIVEFSFQGIFEGVFSDTTPGTIKNTQGTIYHIPIYHHGLGFQPGFHLLRISGSVDSSGNQIVGTIFADNQDFYAEVYPPTTNGAVRFNIKFFLQVYSRDLTKTFVSPIDIAVPSTKSGSSKYGLKITKLRSAGAMNIDDKSQYTLNSNAKSLAYQSHGIQVAETSGTYSGSLIIRHNLGYPPTYFICGIGEEKGVANPSKGKVTTSTMYAGFGNAKSDSLDIRISGAQGALFGKYIYLILKEPVEFSA